MRKINLLFAILSICILLAACGGSDDTSANNDTTETPIVDEAPEIKDAQTDEPLADPEPEWLYFESDEVVETFFVNYNAFAEVVIDANEIEQGNIRTKALVYIDDLSLEVINAGEYLAISMSSAPENEATTLYAIFRDTIKAMNETISEDDIKLAWNAIHESGYLVEDYDFNGMTITYVPSKELSWGTSDLRVDINIPFE